MRGRDSWVGMSAVRIAAAVRRGSVTATEVVADHLRHARLADRVVRAVRVLRDDVAIAEAAQVDHLPDLSNLPLAGVPVLVQENTAVAGLRTWNGSAAAASATVADRDHEVVRRLRGAGAIVVGVSRMSELGLWGMTDDASAVTRNPWRGDRSPGGCAAAAAVAAGLVPLAQGTDGLGSARVSAACCGLVGFKPGRGVVTHGLGVTDWYGIAEHSVIATTAADAVTAFAVLAGRVLAVPPAVDRLRVAVSLRSPVPGVIPDADAREAVAHTARRLVGIGHDVIRAGPHYPARLARMGLATWLAVAHQESSVTAVNDLQPRTRRHASLGSRARGLVREGERVDWRGQCVDWFAQGGFDLLVTPVLAGAPPASRPDRRAGWSTRSWARNVVTNARMIAYTAAWNLAGLPAIVVPMGVRGDGLPRSVQLIGPPGSEHVLLAVAQRLECASPWRRHAPTWPRLARIRVPDPLSPTL